MTFQRARQRTERGRAVAIARHRIRRARRHADAGVRQVAELADYSFGQFLATAWAGDWADTAYDPDWSGEAAWVDAYDVLHAWLVRCAGDGGELAGIAEDLIESLAIFADLWELQVEDWFSMRAA
jgi:hypothetical protein